jgi:hypothetical protein
MDMAAGLDIDGGRAGFRALRIISLQQRFYRHENAAKEAAAQINIVATIDEFYSTVALLWVIHETTATCGSIRLRPSLFLRSCSKPLPTSGRNGSQGLE